MPDHQVHCFVDRKMFGKSYRKLHQAIDKPYVILKQRHRVMFHDPFSCLTLARHLYPYDPTAEEAALLHVELDNMCSRDPFVHKQLILLARQDSRNRKRSRKLKNKTGKIGQQDPPELRDFIESCKKMLKLKNFMRMVRS